MRIEADVILIHNMWKTDDRLFTLETAFGRDALTFLPDVMAKEVKYKISGKVVFVEILSHLVKLNVRAERGVATIHCERTSQRADIRESVVYTFRATKEDIEFFSSGKELAPRDAKYLSEDEEYL